MKRMRELRHAPGHGVRRRQDRDGLTVTEKGKKDGLMWYRIKMGFGIQ